jgi:putative tricarboxylic transport membrane protein
MAETLLGALHLVFTLPSLGAILAGTFVGIIVGALPGLGSVVGVSMVLPFTFAMGPIPSIALLLGVYCGSVYGGSISAVLLNTPGTPASAATCFDGYPMARRGEADAALGWVTASSFFGGIFSLVVLIFAAPFLAKLALRFGPVEYFALMVFSLTCICGVSSGALAKGLMAGALGLFLGTVGADPITGNMRFDFGIFELSGGIGLIPVIVGVFALAEVFVRVSERYSGTQAIEGRVGCRIPSRADWRGRVGTLVKASTIGSIIGVLPGTGAATASFVSYAEAKRSSKNSAQFGHGAPEGIIASEAANNAVTGGALVPTLALGVPGDPVTAVILGSFVLQGITPGPKLFTEQGSTVAAVFLALLLVNIAFLVMGVFGSRVFSRILRVPEPLLMGIVVVLSIIGSYGVNQRLFDVGVTFVAGAIGFLLRTSGVPIAPIVIGMVLGPLTEESLRQGLIVNGGDFLAFFRSPIAVGLFLLTALSILASLRHEWRHRQKT